MKKFKAILFDLDGVLIDSSDAWWLAVNETLKKFGNKGITKEGFLKLYWGPHLRETFKRIGLGEDAVEDCNQQYYKFIDKIKIFPEVKEILLFLKNNKKKIKIGLVSNTPKKNILITLKNLSLIQGYFDVIVGGDEVEKGKPNPEIILKACNVLGINPKNTVLIGDTKSDMLAGKKANAITVGLNVGNGDYKIKNLKDLIKFNFF